MQTLTDWMNISTPIYDSQVHYFQSIGFVSNILNDHFLFSKIIDVDLQILLIHPIS
jgi:hypothetical protein